jgi:polar amino acid transport system substrate-binding protein
MEPAMNSARPAWRPAPWTLFLLMLAAPLLAEEAVPVATYNWPPYVERTLEDHGLAGAVAKEALRRSGLEARFVDEGWSRALAGVEAGEYAVLAGAWRSPERERTLHFTRPFAENRIVFVKKRGGSFTFAAMEATRGQGLSLGVTADFAYSEALEAYRFEPVVTENFVIQNLLRLQNGSIDVAVMDAAVLDYHVTTYLGQRGDGFEASERALATYGLRLAVSAARPDGEALAQRLDEALESMADDGTLDRLRARYVP